jgi:hypothetical protein
MVQAKEDMLGDGMDRPVLYAKFREDRPADKGYTRELISVHVPESMYDAMETEKVSLFDCHTVWQLFERQVKTRGDTPFLATRKNEFQKGNKNPEFGPYEW